MGATGQVIVRLDAEFEARMLYLENDERGHQPVKALSETDGSEVEQRSSRFLREHESNVQPFTIQLSDQNSQLRASKH